jgi:hypothetical protein
MEELQDAIEDAQYVDAIATQEEGPRPVLAWEIPTEEQLAEWVAAKRKEEPAGPEAFSINWCLQSTIGLFLFSTFLKESHHDFPRINFIEDVIRWKKMRGKYRLERAKKIFGIYLKEIEIDEHTRAIVSPPKTQINEHDLCRTLPRLAIKDSKFQDLFESSIDEKKAENVLGIKGDVVKEILSTIESAEKKQSKDSDSRSSLSENPAGIKSKGNVNEGNSLGSTMSSRYESARELTRSWRDGHNSESLLTNNLFDKADAIIVESLRRQYWGWFVESEQYKKLVHFLWFHDRQVVPDDFFNMRVLGRGGFGSVLGEHTIFDDA